MQKWHLLPPAMKCSNCGHASAKLYKAYKERGAGRCPRCSTVHIASFQKHQLKARASAS